MGNQDFEYLNIDEKAEINLCDMETRILQAYLIHSCPDEQKILKTKKWIKFRKIRKDPSNGFASRRVTKLAKLLTQKKLTCGASLAHRAANPVNWEKVKATAGEFIE